MLSKIFSFRTLLFLIVLGLSLFIYKYLVSTKPEAKKVKIEEKTFYVKVMQAKRNNYVPKSDEFGRIVSTRQGDLRFGVPGRVIYISDNFKNGSYVKNGQVLAKLDQKRYLLEVEKLKSDTRELLTQLEIRQRQVKRFKSMLSRKVISQNQYDNELILLSKNQSDYVRSKILLEKAEEDLSYTVLRSKFNGVLYDIKINKGQFLLSNDKIANIFSVDDLEVEFAVPSKIYSNAQNLIGKDIEVVWEASDTSLKTTKGKIIRTGGKIIEEEGGGKIIAKIDNKNLSIPLGAFVRVSYPLDEFLNVLKIPETAIYGNKVYVVENRIARERTVDIKYKGNGYVIINGNLSDYDQIIITKIPEKLNNQKVTITN
jgi:membrane fusion protein (multidrug efflux system)